jgi:Uma2 family endonuclease
VRPDLLVIPLMNGRRPERFEDVGTLLLAIEVLSPSTARADRVAKRVMFRDQGVAEYWVIDLDARAVERSTPADPRVEVLVDRLEWLPVGVASSFVADLSEYFRAVLEG